MTINNTNNIYGKSLVHQLESKYPCQSFKNNQGLNEGETRVRHFSANDIHGHLYAFRQLKTAVDQFRSKNPDGEVFLSGDEWVGGNEKKNELIVRTMNMLKPTAVAPGNHNLDWKGTKGLSKLLDLAKFKTLALNIVPTDEAKKTGQYSLQDDIDAGRFAGSYIKEKDGVKYGYIGLMPTDLMARLNQQSKDESKDISILDLEQTARVLQEETNKLESQGAKIITLVSHLGYDADKYIAQNVSGIDIIHGGHSHDTLEGLVSGKNCFKSPRDEYVLMTQTGKNGHNYSELDVVFDKEGRIIKAKNEVKPLNIFSDSLSIKLLEKIYIGEPKVIGNLAHDVKALPEATLEESALCSFLCDGYRKLTGADIVINNAGSMRSSLSQGPLKDRTIIDMLPFYNDVYTFKMSEKDLVNVLNGAVNATTQCNRPGALQVSGMKYVIGRDNRVKDAYVLKDDGTSIKLNTENPSPDKFYSVAYNSYLLGGPEGVEILKNQEIIKKHDLTETDILLEHIKSFDGKPISIKTDGRIIKEK